MQLFIEKMKLPENSQSNDEPELRFFETDP